MTIIAEVVVGEKAVLGLVLVLLMSEVFVNV
jgi:hypothetical protein